MKAKKTIKQPFAGKRLAKTNKVAKKESKQKFAFAAPVAVFTAIAGKITTFFK